MGKKIIVVAILMILIGFFGYEFYSSKYLLTNSYYTITTGQIAESIRIVQISDLHNSEFGTDNDRLISEVAAQKPDLILVTGDMLNSNKDDTQIATKLIKGMSEIAPVYLSLGNHEKEIEELYGIVVTELFEEAGARVLNFEYEDVIVKGQTIRIGGIYGYCLPEKYLETNEADAEECKFLLDFQDTKSFTILLCHMPCCWLLNDGINEWNIDCIFSGHVHGGEVIFPFIGGLYAPDFGFFPGKLQGLYYSDERDKTLVLSRGLGTSEVIPRTNNVPELVVVDFIPKG